MAMPSTYADVVAALLGNDGQRWAADDGRTFPELMDEFDAHREFGRCSGINDLDQREFEECSEFEHADGPIRYRFPDQSAIVEHGDGWDIEGDRPFTWAGV